MHSRNLRSLLRNSSPGKGALILGVALLASTASQAQLSTLQGTYDFAATTGTYAPLTGGEVAFSYVPPPLSDPFGGTVYTNDRHYVDPGVTAGFPANSDAYLASGYTLPFNFTYNGVVWDRIAVSKGGYITFGSSTLDVPVWHSQQLGTNVFATATNPSTPGATGYARGEVIEQRSRVGFSTSANWGKSPGVFLIKIGTQGTAPNRTYVVQFENFDTGGSTQTGNFQIRLNEGGGNPNNQTVQMAFGSFAWSASNAVSVGLAGSTNADWFTLQGADFASATLGAANTSTITLSGATAPTSGLTYTWTPKSSACMPSASVPVSGLRGTSAIIQWADNGASQLQWEVRAANVSGFGPDALPGTGGEVATNTVPSGTFSATVAGLTPNTKYYAYVRSTCSVTGAWSLAGCFRTTYECGGEFDAAVTPGAYGANLVRRVCPTDVGDVATVSFTSLVLNEFNTDRNTRLYVYNGLSTSNDQVFTSEPASNGSIYYLPSGGINNLSGGAAITPPPVITSGDPNGCLTFKLVSFVGGTWESDVTCMPAPTCYPPTAIAVTPGTQGGSITWTSASAANQYRIVAGGAAVTAPALVQGIVSSVPFTVTDNALLANTLYSLYVRGVCSPGDTSAWSSRKDFRTRVGCGGSFDFYRTASFTGYPNNLDSITTICPNNAGDVVTLTFSAFSYGQSGDDAMYVYDGPNTSSFLLASAQPSTSGGTFPAGGYYGNYGAPGAANFPGPFTSTHSGGCLTVRFRSNASQGSFYDIGTLSSVTCAPAPACATPGATVVSAIGGTSATVTWTGGGSNYIIEYGAPGFTPGTGAAAGVGGTVISNVTSPYTITGLTSTTGYKVVVRQVCIGPSYSANGYAANFNTSLDCSGAEVISCGQLVTVNSVYGDPGNPTYEGAAYTNASCVNDIAGASGTERLFRFTASVSGAYRLNIPTNGLSGSYNKNAFLIAPASSGCGAAAFTCIGLTAANGNGVPIPGFIDFNIPAAGDYFLIYDNYQYSSGSLQFQIYCPGIPPCLTAPTYPSMNTSVANTATPVNFSWPAAFGATGYDFYFQGGLLVSNHPSTSISDPAYTPAAMAALYGIGATITWRVVPRNSYGVATCPMDFTFRVGGNGDANAIPVTSGVAVGASQRTANGYTNAHTTYFGTDAVFSFTAGECANGSASVAVCMTDWVTQNYVNMYIVRASDLAAIGAPFQNYIAIGACGTLNVTGITPGQNYYIILDAYSGQMDFNLTFTEGQNTTDTDGDGILDCVDSCPETPGEVGSPCYAGPLFGSAVVNDDCECEGSNPIPCTTDLVLEFQTDGNPFETTWEIREQGTDFLVRSGGPLNPQNSVETNFACLPDGCFYLRVLDSAGDGMTTGGYILRTQGDNLRIIDNRNNFNTGSISAISGGQGFCLPMGNSTPIYSSCDKLDWVTNKFIVATEDPAVSAQYGVTNSTSGYVFWFFDPNGSYSFRRFRSHATSDGFGTGALRANHFRLNAWTNTPSSPHLPNNVLLNVRIRSRISGVNQEWGPACQFKMDAALAACPRVSLEDNPNTNEYSCGVNRVFGGANNWTNRLTAHPPQPIPVVSSANVRYQFRFRIPGEAVCIVRPPQTSPRIFMNWSDLTGPQLECGKQYEVDVRVSLDGGATWCFDVASPSCAEPVTSWGKVCFVNITTSTVCAELSGAGNDLAPVANGGFTMYPNPNNGEQLFLSLSAVDADVRTVSVDIFDLTGKRVNARTISVQDGFVKTTVELNHELASGLYLVNVTAGKKTYTERLVIQH